MIFSSCICESTILLLNVMCGVHGCHFNVDVAADEQVFLRGPQWIRRGREDIQMFKDQEGTIGKWLSCHGIVSLAASGAALMPERPRSVVTSLIVVVSVIDPISSFQKAYKVSIIPARIDGGIKGGKNTFQRIPEHKRPLELCGIRVSMKWWNSEG